MSEQQERLRSVLTQFGLKRHRYILLATYMQRRIAEIAQEQGIYPMISARAKSLESLAEKIFRPGKNYGDHPLEKLSDLCGVRVITHTLDQVDQMAEAIKKDFHVDLAGVEDASERLDVDRFGYLSKHYTIQFKRPPTDSQVSRDELLELPDLKAELQLRTIAQHLWADIYHDLGYKNEFQLPRRWSRDFSRIAATLEGVDQGFQAIKDSLGIYESSYGGYMDDDKLIALADRLETLLEVDSRNAGAAHRLLRAYLSLDLETVRPKLATLIERFDFPERPRARRDAAIAGCKLYPIGSDQYEKHKGQLEAIAERDKDLDAWCSLGGIYKREVKLDKALACYRTAYELDPTNPYPLGNYMVRIMVGKRAADVLAYFRAPIQMAADRCQKQIEAGVNLPWALFDMAMFQIYLGRPEDGLRFHAKGIDAAAKDWMIGTHLVTIEELKAADIDLPGLEWSMRFLRLAASIRAGAQVTAEPDPARAKFGEQVLILAGGCGGLDRMYETQLAQLATQLEAYRGTLIGGGTTSGVAAIPGILQERLGSQLQTIGYVPAADTEGLQEQLDTRYARLRHTEGKVFSPLEPLTFWEDYLGAGGDPRRVRLLGFNGGDISACEYRMALALGAKVAIITGSGRQADAFLRDPLWNPQPAGQQASLQTRSGPTRVESLEIGSAELDAFLA